MVNHQERSILFNIWKEAFDEEDDYINFFISKGLPLGHLLTLHSDIDTQTGKPEAALTLFPISLYQEGKTYQGYYLYALGTLRSKRGVGLGKALVNKALLFTKETKRHFIILQLANLDLNNFYARLGFNMPVFRSFIDCNIEMLLSPSKNQSELFHLLSLLSINNKTIPDRFEWPNTIREYINKECLFREGQLVEKSYCYPSIINGINYLEIKEFCAPLPKIPSLVEKIIATFSHINHFRFFGKPISNPNPLLHTEPFSRLHFVDAYLEKHYQPFSTYFALGLD